MSTIDDDKYPYGYVVIPLDVATIVDNVFLPTNPNKLRSGTPHVRECAREFRQLVSAAIRARTNPIGETK